jgi:hypothetical protein
VRQNGQITNLLWKSARSEITKRELVSSVGAFNVDLQGNKSVGIGSRRGGHIGRLIEALRGSGKVKRSGDVPTARWRGLRRSDDDRVQRVWIVLSFQKLCGECTMDY